MISMGLGCGWLEDHLRTETCRENDRLIELHIERRYYQAASVHDILVDSIQFFTVLAHVQGPGLELQRQTEALSTQML